MAKEVVKVSPETREAYEAPKCEVMELQMEGGHFLQTLKVMVDIMKKMEIKVEDGNSVIIMKKSSLFLSVALLIGATSCTEEVFVQNIKDGSEAVELEFEAASS